MEAQVPIRSKYAAVPKFAPILRKFPQRLAEQLGSAAAAADAGDMEELARVAHALSGVAGTLGFEELTAVARQLVAQARGADAQAARGLLEELRGMAGRVEVPQEPA